MEEVLKSALSVLALLLSYGITLLANYITKIIKEKIKNQSVSATLETVSNIVLESVNTIAQTYVDDMKKQNLFDKTAQETAFKKAYQTAQSMLTEKTKKVIEETFGNVEEYLTVKIESAVKQTK